MIHLVVVRHGETDWNRVGRLQGHTDIALNATGIDQAARLAAALANASIAAIYASDLGRALATAEPVAAALGLPVHREARLRERNYGILEGHTFEEIVERHPAEAARMRARDAAHTMPSGESQQTFSRRVVDAVTSIAVAEEAAHGRDASLLIVTHGGVLDMLYRAATGRALDAERTWATPNAVVNRFALDGDRLTLKSWNETTE